MVAVFDTVFHRTIPDHAALYAIPIDLAQRNKIRRYGFHGISHRYLMLRYAQINRRPISHPTKWAIPRARRYRMRSDVSAIPARS